MSLVTLAFNKQPTTETSLFSRGYLEISGDKVLLTNQGKTPDQSCMLILTLINMFDALSELKSHQKKRASVYFEGCSYEWIMSLNDRVLKIEESKRNVIECDLDSFAEQLKSEVDLRILPELESISASELDDFRKSFVAFNITFGYENKNRLHP